MLAMMREHGLLAAAGGLGLHGHACWAYSDDAELVHAAAEYLADGELGRPTDSDRLLETYSAATDAALAEGFTGLRVAADVTELAVDPACHCRWEAVADRFMAERPLSALCCYDRRRLAPEALRDLCSVHPAANESVPFRIYAARDRLLLEGEIDYFSSDALERVLPLTRGDGVLDLSGAGFIDHHGARILSDSGVPLAGIPDSMRRACELIALAS